MTLIWITLPSRKNDLIKIATKDDKTTSIKKPESGYDALAVIQIADTESKLFLNDADGPAITVKELPYGFDTEKT